MRRVFVTGHRGMLGSVVARHLAAAGYTVIVSEARYTGRHDDPLVAAVRGSRPDAVVNCAAAIPASRSDPATMLLVNGLLPAHLAVALSTIPLVQPSTDCVFDGRATGAYRVSDPPDATDAYGVSKAVGERIAATAVVLRTSVIGLPAQAGRGLLGWFLASAGPVPGYLDHRWNGITTRTWARLAERAIVGDIGAGLHHPTTEPVSKAALLALAAEAFGHRIEIVPDLTGDPLDRTLVPTLPVPPLAEQLAELAA